MNVNVINGGGGNNNGIVLPYYPVREFGVYPYENAFKGEVGENSQYAGSEEDLSSIPFFSENFTATSDKIDSSVELTIQLEADFKKKTEFKGIEIVVEEDISSVMAGLPYSNFVDLNENFCIEYQAQYYNYSYKGKYIGIWSLKNRKLGEWVDRAYTYGLQNAYHHNICKITDTRFISISTSNSTTSKTVACNYNYAIYDIDENGKPTRLGQGAIPLSNARNRSMMVKRISDNEFVCVAINRYNQVVAKAGIINESGTVSWGADRAWSVSLNGWELLIEEIANRRFAICQKNASLAENGKKICVLEVSESRVCSWKGYINSELIHIAGIKEYAEDKFLAINYSGAGQLFSVVGNVMTIGESFHAGRVNSNYRSKNELMKINDSFCTVDNNSNKITITNDIPTVEIFNSPEYLPYKSANLVNGAVLIGRHNNIVGDVYSLPIENEKNFDITIKDGENDENIAVKKFDSPFFLSRKNRLGKLMKIIANKALAGTDTTKKKIKISHNSINKELIVPKIIFLK